MRADHLFKVFDLHSGGAPSRLILSGIPPLAGATMMDKMLDFAAHHDWIRRALVLEPRGRDVTSGIVLLPPTRPDADVGAFFIEAHGCLPMCGSDTICTVTALLETGQLPITGAETVVRLDTPAGLIEATATVEDGRVSAVTFVGAPAFCLLPRQVLTLPPYGDVVVDVSYGGNFYAITDADQLGIALDPENVEPATEFAAHLERAVNEQLDVRHPELDAITGVSHVQLYSAPADPAEPTSVMVIMSRGLVDRSPCGTGTTAKVATLVSQRGLDLGEPFVHQSITGARYTGVAVQSGQVGTTASVRVAITGSAFLTADSTIYVDRRDVLAEGFRLG
ncbi:MAG: proline racemase family protein [Actinomycetales bacterium]